MWVGTKLYCAKEIQTATWIYKNKKLKELEMINKVN